MEPLRRIILGLGLAMALCTMLWTMMSGCSLDWTVPEPGEDAGVDHAVPDTGDTGADADADAPVDQAVDQAIDVSLDVDIDALDGSFDAIVGDAVVPCVQQPDCASCVQCVLGEVAAIGNSWDCKLFGGCMVLCLVGHDLVPCIEYCGENYSAGLQVRMALDGTCLGLCGGAVPCE